MKIIIHLFPGQYWPQSIEYGIYNITIPFPAASHVNSNSGNCESFLFSLGEEENGGGSLGSLLYFLLYLTKANRQTLWTANRLNLGVANLEHHNRMCVPS